MDAAKPLPAMGSRASSGPERPCHVANPSPDLYDDAQTKAATMNYVKSLAKQLGAKGIRVNGVAPGPIWTPLQVRGGSRAPRAARRARFDLRPARRQ